MAACGRCIWRARGSALVIVLAFVAVIMVLVVAVLETGVSSTKHGALMTANSAVEALERVPAQIVLTQLQRATTPSHASDGERLLWTSQPGMIRVFGTRVPSGMDRPPPRMHYRLYSSPVMTSPTLDLAAESAGLGDWASMRAGFTDLNQPVPGTRTRQHAPVFPIADGASIGRVEGFALRSAAPGATPAHPLPMPAAWIYVLRNGSLVTPSALAGARATFEAAVVTKDNPIIGRIAFWTDDESCKLNLNTASEAAAWDMPGANTRTERGYAEHAPQAPEHHRVSGHPSFTSLSPVLKIYGGAGPGSLQWPKPDPAGSVRDAMAPWQWCYQTLVPHGMGADLVVRQDRHFATVEEFLLDPQRKRNGADAGFLMEPDDCSRGRFFLTTHSAAPELNPFGHPKIALWMVPQEKNARSATDRPVALSASLNAGTSQRHEYVFQRASEWSGISNQGSSQSMTDDWAQVARNRELYAWLQSLAGQAMPGFGGCFLDKYGPRSRDQILTSMLDMLRWSANTASYLPPPLGSRNPQGLAEQSAVPLTIDSPAGRTRGYGRFPTVTEIAVVFAFTDVERRPDGQPRDDNHDGICDRAAKLRAFMVLSPFVPACGPPAASPAWSVRIRRLMQWTIGAGISLQLPGGDLRNRCTLSGSQPLGSGVAWGGNSSAYACFASQFMQAGGVPKEVGRRDDPARGFPFVSLGDISLQGGSGIPGTTLRFSGGRIIVDLMDPEAPLAQPKPNDACHSVEVEFPAVQLPMPALQVSDFTGGARKMDDRFQPVRIGGVMRLPLLQRGDIVRSMILNANGPSRGDARLLASRRELFFPEAANWFAPHPDYTSATLAVAQSLRDGAFMTEGQYGVPNPQPTRKTAGTLLANVAYADNAIPSVPPGLNGATSLAVGADPGGRLGDWESGAGLFEDGPFVSRLRSAPEACFTRGSFPGATPPLEVEPLGEVASGFCFGAIPSGVYGDAASATPRPWQTLLFCPNPAGRTTPSLQPGRHDGTAHDHFGFASPPDHLWLEFFTMPVTKPWPMTAGFATEGKVNLNHQLMPFLWMERATALHGALKGVRITAIPTFALDASGDSAKGGAQGGPLDGTFRYEVDPGKTVQGINQRLNAGDVFRTPSQICEQFLVPKRIEGHTYDGGGFGPRDPAAITFRAMTDWWNGDAVNPADAFEATGDNLREAPYAQLYPRLCTQSNVYRVHYRVQLLTQSRASKPEEWDEDRNHITAERRGSCVIERHLEITTDPLPDPATAASAPSLHERQAFRVVSQTPFNP